jgi:hypothetical protein
MALTRPVLEIDLGTSSAKVAIYDSATARVESSAIRNAAAISCLPWWDWCWLAVPRDELSQLRISAKKRILV